ncbi:MAG: RNA polymerase sigma factor [Sporolactobacillus sp.]
MQTGWKRVEVDTEFERVIHPLMEPVQRYCRRLAGSKQDGEDLSQIVLMKLYHAWEKVPYRSLSKAYVHRVISNTWIDRHRHRSVAETLRETFDDMSLSEVQDSDFRLEEGMNRLLGMLPVKQRVLIMLIDGLGCTAAEVGEWLGESSGTIRVSLHRARKKLARPQEGFDHFNNEREMRRYLQAFRSADPQILLQLLKNDKTHRHLSPDISISQCLAA